jgi:homocysteine S-methyltransferase
VSLVPDTVSWVLDGGLSNALAERGYDLTGPLWTARLLRDGPGAIANVHRDYFRAGARIATTASYQASLEGFRQLGETSAGAESLLRRSVVIAQEVRDDFVAADGVHRLVAASVGPYGAVLADGSEYRGRYRVGAARLRDFHRRRLDVLAAAEPDLIAVETIPDVDEALVLAEILDEVGLAAWFSFSVAGSLTRAGDPLAEAFLVAAAARNVQAIGVNCCSPDDVLPAVQLAVETTGLPAVAYPNRGEDWDPVARSWRGEGRFDAGLAPAWAAAGAVYIGGCCQVGPSDIAAIAARLDETSKSEELP